MLVPFLMMTLAVASPDAASRGHDPWVFRCALDRQPRMVVIALAPGWWMAFDAQQCRVHKVWRGDVEFTGTVYDTKHGPQPRAVGDPLVSTAAPMLAGSPAAARWRGYRFAGGEVVLRFDVGDAAVELTPVLRLPPAGDGPSAAAATLEWRFSLSNLPDGKTVDLPLDRAAQTAGPDVIRLGANGEHVARLEFRP